MTGTMIRLPSIAQSTASFTMMIMAWGCSSTGSNNADSGSTSSSNGGAPGPNASRPSASGGLVSAGTASGSRGGSVGGSNVPAGGSASSSTSCMAAKFLSSIGKTSVMLGASMQDATGNLAPFDGRYQYLAGGFFDGTDPCDSCATGCTSNGASCASANTAGCGWWGCWQWDQDPPGQYILNFMSITDSATYNGQAHPQIPMFSYYEVLPGSGVSVGLAEVPTLSNQAFLHKYFADFRFVLQKVGNHLALLHIEPDFWGYVEESGNDPHAMPAPVAGANPSDCSSFENSIAGVGHCLISMVRKYAPNAKVGLHASGWGTTTNVLSNTDASLDVASEGNKLGKFLIALGAADGDFIATDMSDRDAGFYQKQGLDTWWDPTNATLPNFHQAFAWAKSVSDTINKPIVWWQIPVGNMSQNDTLMHYRDNRVDYLFSHLDEVVAANGAALFFGAGEVQQTTPETDGGNLIAKVQAYAVAPLSPCP